MSLAQRRAYSELDCSKQPTKSEDCPRHQQHAFLQVFYFVRSKLLKLAQEVVQSHGSKHSLLSRG